MNDQAKPNDISLVRASRGDLAPISPATPLVSRGVADIAWVSKIAQQQATLAVPCRLTINIPGELSVQMAGSDLSAGRPQESSRFVRQHSHMT